jgi:hypothetical protein
MEASIEKPRLNHGVVWWAGEDFQESDGCGGILELELLV